MTNETKPGGRPLSELPSLSRYGMHISGVTPEGRKRMPGLMLRAAVRELGPLRAGWFLLCSALRGRALARAHPEAARLARAYSPAAARDFPMLGGMFATLADWEGEDRAYAFLKGVMQASAPFQMAELYQVDELRRFEDRFEAFKRFNRAMFTGDPNYRLRAFIDEGDTFRVHLESCVNCAIAEAFGFPRLAQLGCDHDVAGYPAIEDDVEAVFRRPQTIAKGGAMCEFVFHRRGTEPTGPYENR